MYKKIGIIAFISILLDQVSKMLIDTYLGIGSNVSIIKGFFSITRASNTGAAFSILEGKTIVLVIISVLAIYLLIKYISSFKEKALVYVAFGLTLGGIIGNLIDRVFLGYVRDFLKFVIFGYNYPVFNIADISIVVGVILLIICIIRGDEIGNNSKR